MVWPFTPPLVVLVHMPKAGGTTLSEIMHAVYGYRLLVANPPDGWRQAWTTELRTEIWAKRRYWRAFSGHTAYGIHTLFARPAVYLSSVRDPMERFESYYGFIRRSREHHYHQMAQALGIGEFYRYQRDTGNVELYNFQCQLICGRKDFATAREYAKTRYSAIAPLSMFRPAVDWIRRHMGWPDGPVAHLNRTIEKAGVDDLTEADRRELLRGNQADADLVKLCEDLMAARLAGRSAPANGARVVVPARGLNRSWRVRIP